MKLGRHQYFVIFVFPIVAVLALVTCYGYWALSNLHEQQAKATVIQAQKLATLNAAARLSIDMSTIQSSVQATLQDAFMGRLTDAIIYQAHAKLVDSLASLKQRTITLVQSPVMARLAEQDRAGLLEDFEKYDNLVISATDIAAIDAAQAGRYVQQAQSRFIAFSNHAFNIGGILGESIARQNQAEQNAFNDLVHRVIIVGLLGLLVVLATGVIVAYHIGRRTESITEGLQALAHAQHDPPALPALETMNQRGWGIFRELADAVLTFRDAILQRNEAVARHQAIVDTVIDGIVVIDEQGRIDLVNPAMETMFGYRADEMIGQPVAILMPDSIRGSHQGHVHDYVASSRPKIIGMAREVEGQRRDGTLFPIDIAVSETPIAGRRLFTALMRDISARKQAERDLIHSLKLQREFERHATLDGLTGLHNRRWMSEAFVRQLSRCAGAGQAVCLIMLDVDHFKHYNDTYGHPGGDCALRVVGEVLTGCIRPNDLAARYGGEEFCIMLPATDMAAALIVAERVRSATAGATVTSLDDTLLPSITVSIGLTESQPDDTLETMIARADTALYRAKKEGRNRVVAC